MGASEIHARRLNAKEMITPKRVENLTFLIADEKAEPLGRDQVLKASTLMRDHPERGEEQGVLRGESDASQPSGLFPFGIVIALNQK